MDYTNLWFWSLVMMDSLKLKDSTSNKPEHVLIYRKLHSKKDKRDQLLQQLENVVNVKECELIWKIGMVNPREVILKYDAPAIITWAGLEDQRIIQSLLKKDYVNYKYFDVTCEQSSIIESESSSFNLHVYDKDDDEVFCAPHVDLPHKRGQTANLGEAHAAICSQNHGPPHHPLADAEMLRCIVEKCVPSSVFC